MTLADAGRDEKIDRSEIDSRKAFSISSFKRETSRAVPHQFNSARRNTSQNVRSTVQKYEKEEGTPHRFPSASHPDAVGSYTDGELRRRLKAHENRLSVRFTRTVSGSSCFGERGFKNPPLITTDG